MRLSIQRLRWILVAGAALLVVVVAAYIGYGRYRALKAYRQILAHSGVAITRDSNGVTWSQSVKNRKLYTIRAKTETSLGDGKYGLRDAELLLYTRSEDHPDHIYGSEMEYDQNAGILRAKGEVFMDLQPPGALSDSSRSSAQPAPGQIIHVRTSGLVYVRKLGVASTTQQVFFSYGGMQCSALGAEFNSDQSMVRLLASVHLDGFAHGHPLHVIATRADMNRTTNIANVSQPVAISEGRKAASSLAILHLRKDGSIEQIDAIDQVVLNSGAQQVTASRLDATLTPASVVETGRLAGGVVLTDSDASRPMHGTAQIVDALFDAKGSPARVIANGAAQLSMIDRRRSGRGLSRSMRGDTIVAYFAPGKRRSSSMLHQIHATGAAHAYSESLANESTDGVAGNTRSSLKTVQISGDDLKLLLTASADGKTEPQTLYGRGRTVLQQDAPLGQQEISRGDTLEMVFDTAPEASTELAPKQPVTDALSIRSVVQSGNVTISERAAGKPQYTESKPAASHTVASKAVVSQVFRPGSSTTGSAAHAVYNGSTQKLVLTGNAHLYGGNASIIAPTVSLDQLTQDADASGGVQAAFEDRASDPFQSELSANDERSASASSSAAPPPVTHILASTAHFQHATQSAVFHGTDAQPAMMWRQGSQVMAATLFFDGVKRIFRALPEHPGTLIHAVFASAPTAPKSGRASQAASIIRVASPTMNYDDLNRQATFSNGVTINGAMGDVRGDQAVVFMAAAPGKLPASGTAGNQDISTLQPQPSPFGGSIDRVVVDGSVQMTQPDRRGTGEQLLYVAATGSCILTGTPEVPPRIVDAQQGSVTGKTLLFTDAGSTIVAAGDPVAPRSAGVRVRTQTRVTPAKEERQQTHEKPRN